MLDEGRAAFEPIALDHVEHAWRQPRLMRDLGEQPGRAGRVLGRLEHRGIAADQRREHLPRDVGDRRVRRDDEPRHAARLAHGHGVFVGRSARRGAAVEPLAFAGEEAAERDRASGLAESLLRRLAGLARDHLGEVLLMRLERIADAVEHEPAPHRRRRRPRALRGTGSSDRRIDIVLARPRDGEQQGAVMRRALLEGRARDGVTLLAADPVAYGRVGRDWLALPCLAEFLEGREAAVSNDIRSGHIGRGVRQQELHHAVIFAGVGHPPERHLGVIALEKLGILVVVDAARA